MRATKLVLTVKHLKCKKRLIRLQLPTLRSNQIKFKFIFSTQYNNEFALRLAGQTGDNFALMSAHDN